MGALSALYHCLSDMIGSESEDSSVIRSRRCV